MTLLTHVSDLAAGYAFGALASDEQTQVETHIDSCRDCAEIIREAVRVAALLPYSVTPYKAPPDLKQRVLDQATAETTPVATVEPESPATPPVRAVAAAPQPHTPRRPFVKPWVAEILLRTLPWTLAVIGWVLVAALAIFSHGQADRINATRQDDDATISALTTQRDQAQVIQQYLLTPGVAIVPMIYKAGIASPQTNVVLFEIPGYLHAVVGARGLAKLPKDRTYAVWARKGLGSYVALGTLTTSGPAAQGVSVVVAPMPVDQYSQVGITIEQLPVPAQPGRHLAFVATL
jgi:hypothetical protein